MSSVPSHTHCVPLLCVPRPPGRLGRRAALFTSAVDVLGGYDSAVISAPLQFIKKRRGADVAVKATFPLRVQAIALDFVPEGPTLEQIAAYRRPVPGPRVSPEPGPGAVRW